MSATACQCSAQWGCKNATLMEANKQNCSDFVENPWNIGEWNINFHKFSLTICSPHSPHFIFMSKSLQKCHKNHNHEFSFLWPYQALCNALPQVPFVWIICKPHSTPMQSAYMSPKDQNIIALYCFYMQAHTPTPWLTLLLFLWKDCLSQNLC